MDDTGAKFLITELISHYGNCLDAGDFDAMEALFVEDAVFRVLPATGVPPLVGKRGIREAVKRRWTLVHKEAQRRHVMSNIVVGPLSPDGRSASARTVLLVYEVGKAPGSQIHLHGMGVYDDSVVLEAGRWRFHERQLTLDRTDYFAPGWSSTR
jgi:3-phenylpropionate/cinnamic acid dioxygenase small subunit